MKPEVYIIKMEDLPKALDLLDLCAMGRIPMDRVPDCLGILQLRCTGGVPC